MIDRVVKTINQQQPELVLVLGPTATGKTGLAFDLADRLKFDLISVDSRQVYQDLDIVTGKDIPSDFIFSNKGVNSFYTSPQDFRLYGVSCCPANQNFSLGLFLKALPVWCRQIKNRRRRIILVGGTIHWFYRLLSGKFEQAFIPQNINWRRQAKNLSLEKIQNEIINKAGRRPDFINHDDWHNRQRLIRWYERLTWSGKLENGLQFQISRYLKVNRLSIIIEPDLDIIKKNIKRRIQTRLAEGAIAETQSLLDRYGRQITGLSAPGYQQIIAYLDKKLDYQNMIDDWLKAELNLVKRQRVWLKKIKQDYAKEVFLIS